MVLFGAVASLELVWSLGDFFMACLTLVNVTAIAILGKYAFHLLDDYRRQKRAGIKDPIFRASSMPDIEKELEWWK